MFLRNVLVLTFCFVFFSVSSQNSSDCNCCSENHKAFDFWIGNWKVTKASDGTPAGTSKISQEENGCVILENWTSAQVGYTGTSLNFYNANSKQWEQLWVDNTGAALKLKGERVGNKMILSSVPFTKDGKSFTNRITWTKNDDGTVRQLWEVLQGDEVVNTAFDGIYTKE